MTAEDKVKKGANTKLIIIIVAVLAILGVGGFLLNKYVINKTAEEIIEQGTGGDVDVKDGGEGASIETEQGSADVGTAAKWPTDLPAGIPEFTAGKLTVSTKTEATPASWSMMASEVAESDVTKYKNDLTALGWSAQTSIIMGASITQLVKGEVMVSLTYDSSGQSLTITVSYENS